LLRRLARPTTATGDAIRPIAVAVRLRLDVPAVQARGDTLRDNRDRVGSTGLTVCGPSLIAAELVRVDGLECGVGRC